MIPRPWSPSLDPPATGPFGVAVTDDDRGGAHGAARLKALRSTHPYSTPLFARRARTRLMPMGPARLDPFIRRPLDKRAIAGAQTRCVSRPIQSPDDRRASFAIRQDSAKDALHDLPDCFHDASTRNNRSGGVPCLTPLIREQSAQVFGKVCP